MARVVIDPAAHGVPLSNEEFKLKMDEAHKAFTALSLDETLLRPRMALQFCDKVRMENHWYDLPDDIILRAVMQLRK
ncbi:hypothetical protein BH11PLA2_BH11PLA2_46290 [soil metagenome]